MSDPDKNNSGGASDAVRDSFQHELNLHGFGFQFRVLKEARDLHEARKSKWVFRVSEFPVHVQGSGTRIDFVLFRTSGDWWQADMICECKRANPATAYWCFIKAPFVYRGYPKASDPLVFESVVRSSLNMGALRTRAVPKEHTRDAYHVALPIRTGRSGDAQPVKQSRNEIEDAASQVMRGTNGYVETLSRHPQVMESGEQESIIRLVPVIFTTANLFVSKSDLSTADLETGNVNLQSGQLERVPWIWYQYNVSPGIKHATEPQEKQTKLEDYMLAEHIRSIGIVSPSGIEEFLQHTSESF